MSPSARRRPLAAASARLRARPGRPLLSAGHSAGHSVRQVRAATAPVARALAESAAAPLRPRLVSIEDGGRYLGVSAKTLRRWVADGRLATVRLGRRVLVELAALDHLVEAAKRDA